MRRSLLILPLLLLILPHAAHATSEVSKLLSTANNLQAWRDNIWLNLGHYEGDGDDPTQYRSQADDQRFFLAPDGKTNPASELIATINAFYSTEASSNNHALCRFPARLEWLSKTLQIDKATLPQVSCTDYIEWRGMIKAAGVTMVFPAYHLNSPSSMFGHTLLRLDPPADDNWSDWLSYAVNFGADVRAGDNSLFYAFKGLSGGYSGIFIVEPYFKKIQEYNKIEKRDIFEYRLNLSMQETETMVTHLWEVKTINFDYYFFDENCSYRLLELLEVARPGIELTDEFKLTAIPVDTVRAIERAGLISTTVFRPSQSTTLQALIERIPENHHYLIEQAANNIDTLTQSPFTDLDETEQRDIVEAAYRYLRYLQTGEARDPEIAGRSYKLLKKMNSYPASGLNIADTIIPPVAPELGHGSKRASLGIGKRLDNTYAELAFRMSFHDLEDNEKGFLRGAQINIGSIQLRAEENESLRLYKLDLVDIFSLTTRTRFLKPLSWKVYTGLERQLTKGIDQLTAHVTGGAGGSWQLFNNNQIYALATARLEANKQLDRAIEPAIGFTTGVLQHFGSSTIRLDASGEQFSDGVYRLRAGYTQNIVISTNHSIRLSAKYEWQEVDEFSDIQLRYQYYF